MVFLFYSWIADFVPMTLTDHLFDVVEPFFCQNRQSCMSPLSSIRHPEEASTRKTEEHVSELRRTVGRNVAQYHWSGHIMATLLPHSVTLLMSHNLNRFLGHPTISPYFDVVRCGHLGRMGTFRRFKTSNDRRDKIDRLQTVLPCLLRPTILVWSGMPVSARAAKTLIYSSMPCRSMVLPKDSSSPTKHQV